MIKVTSYYRRGNPTPREKAFKSFRTARKNKWYKADIFFLVLFIVYAGYLASHIKLPFWAPQMPVKTVLATDSIVTPLTANRTVTGTPTPTPTPSPTPRATLGAVIGYVVEKWSPEGKTAVMEALNCFFTESGFEEKASHYNAWNGTNDKGIAMINDVHRQPESITYNYRKNIDYAFKLWKEQGWKPWYGVGCGRLAYK